MQYPNIAVLPNVTRVTRIEYRRRSPTSASGVRPYGDEPRAGGRNRLAVDATRPPTAPDADRCRREALSQSAYVPALVPRSTCGLHSRVSLPPLYARLCQ